MNKKIIAELQKYLDGLKNNAPAGEYARAMQAFQALTTALETIDPRTKRSKRHDKLRVWVMLHCLHRVM
jgi:hypothetical protein